MLPLDDFMANTLENNFMANEISAMLVKVLCLVGGLWTYNVPLPSSLVNYCIGIKSTYYIPMLFFSNCIIERRNKILNKIWLLILNEISCGLNIYSLIGDISFGPNWRDT